jgi:hypothetical protein
MAASGCYSNPSLSKNNVKHIDEFPVYIGEREEVL